MWRYILPFGSLVSARELRRQKCINRALSMVRRNIIGFSSEELSSLKRHAQTFDFLHNRTFVYETESVFLMLFLQNSRKDDYIVIYRG